RWRAWSGEAGGEGEDHGLERPLGVAPGLASDVRVQQGVERQAHVILGEPLRQLEGLLHYVGLGFQHRRGGPRHGSLVRLTRPEGDGLRQQHELPDQRPHHPLGSLALVEELPRRGERTGDVAVGDAVDQVERVVDGRPVGAPPHPTGTEPPVERAQLVHLGSDACRVLSEQLGQRRRHVRPVAQVRLVQLPLYRPLETFVTRRGQVTVLTQGRPLLLPCRGRLGVDDDDKGGVAHTRERCHHLVTRLHACLTGERRPEVEQQRDLAEQAALPSEMRHVVRRHPLRELGDVARPHPTISQGALRCPPGQERVTAERQDHAGVRATASSSALSSRAEAGRAPGSRERARKSTLSNGRAVSGRGLSGTLSSPARYLTTWPPYGGSPLSMWYSTAATAYRSDRWSVRTPWNCSGAM